MKYKALKVISSILGLCLCINPIFAQDYVATPVSISKEKVKGADGKVYYSHIVIEKQTLFGIAKAYSVSIEDLYKINPNLKEEGLKTNSYILIPINNNAKNEDNTSVTKQTNNTQDYKTHIVKWYESINDIARKYNVPADIILKFNNISKIKTRMALKIPTNPATPTTDTKAENIDTTSTQDNDYTILNPINNKDFKIVLMLPFNANGKVNNDNLDFYNGVLMALKNCEEAGVNIDLSVYDCATNLPITKTKLDETDVVIGPISMAQLQNLTTIAGNKTMIVSPLDQKASSIAKSNSNFIQIPPKHIFLFKDITNWIKDDYHNKDIVLTISNKSETTPVVKDFYNIIQSSGINTKYLSYNLLEGREIDGKLRTIFSKDGVNRIIINSEDEAFIGDVFRNLNILSHEGYEVIVYCTSKVRNMESIDVENLHELQTHVATLYYIDYTQPKIKDFVFQYRALFNNEPNQFAFQGHDICQYLIQLFSTYGKDWVKNIDKVKMSLLQDNIDIKPYGEGYLNHGTRRIVYNKDYTITLIK